MQQQAIHSLQRPSTNTQYWHNSPCTRMCFKSLRRAHHILPHCNLPLGLTSHCICAQARAASAESALRAAQSAAAESSGRVAKLTNQLETEQRRLGTAQAAVQAAAERLNAAGASHAQEKGRLELQMRELQEHLWEAEEKVRTRWAYQKVGCPTKRRCILMYVCFGCACKLLYACSASLSASMCT